MTSAEGGVGSVHRALRSAVESVYRHSVATVAISVGWVIASLPVVTLGASTLGAYAAVRSLRRDGRVDRSAVARTVSSQWLNATLLVGVLVVLGATAALYAGRFLATGSATAGALAVVALYLSFQYWVVLVAAFVALADGDDLTEAVAFGYRWSIDRPVAMVLLGTVTGVLLAASAALTVTLALIFPALASAFHTALLVDSRRT